MQMVRSSLRWLLTVSLVCQLTGVMAPTMLTAAGAGIEEVCTCPDAVHGATCPMHHKAAATSDNPNQCALKNAATPLTVALLTIAGVGVIPSIDVFSADIQSAAFQPASGSGLSSRTELPDSPPPRR